MKTELVHLYKSVSRENRNVIYLLIPSIVFVTILLLSFVFIKKQPQDKMTTLNKAKILGEEVVNSDVQK